MDGQYDALVVITPKDFQRVSMHYQRLVRDLTVRRLFFVGSNELKELLAEAGLSDQAGFLCEDDILPFQAVHEVMTQHMQPLLSGRELPRGVTGWYYQQFLKMQYARVCDDPYYLVWDGDTISCRQIRMFDDQNRPFMDMKKEYHKEYFDTIAKLFPGMDKKGSLSYISEHMLIRSDIMTTMLAEIESDERLEGGPFWERIIKAIEPGQIQNTAFSEFETYGTYCSYRYPDAYVPRRWHSFRNGAVFFDVNTISAHDFEWLGKDFFAISFEKNQSVREDHRNLFDNPRYQSRLSAKQMLLIAQEEFEEGYLESWEDETDG